MIIGKSTEGSKQAGRMEQKRENYCLKLKKPTRSSKQAGRMEQKREKLLPEVEKVN